MYMAPLRASIKRSRLIHTCSVRIKTHIVCCYSHACALLWTKISFFALKEFAFCIRPTRQFNFSCIYVLFVLKHAQFGVSLLFSELVSAQKGVTLFGPAFSRSCIFSHTGDEA